MALLAMRCPRCLRGKPFDGYASMRADCPVCDLHFEREPGYFVGSMYISYALSIVAVLLLTGVVHLIAPDADLGLAAFIAGVVYLPLVPITWRYSRLIWMYFDRWAWPDNVC